MKKAIIAAVIILVLVILAANSVFTVREDQYACTIRFSQIINVDDETMGRIMSGGFENLEQVKTEYLSEAALNIYTPMWEEIAESYYEQVYNNAYTYYNADNFTEAIPLFLKIVEKDVSYKDGSACYYLAQSYRKNNDLESAKSYYQYIIENYPNTEYARTAENYINEE